VGVTPADKGYEVSRLFTRVADLEARLSRLEWAHRVNAQKAHVQTYVSGSTCVVEFDATGNTAVVGFPYPFYTPSSGHGGYVVDLGAGSMFLPVSAF
jgi:hypothetical protein